MNKIYIVFDGLYDNRRVVGVFDNENQAFEKMLEIKNLHEEDYKKLRWDWYDDCEVWEANGGFIERQCLPNKLDKENT